MWKDPIVDEIRKIREEHAARFNYDLDAIFRDLRASQERSGREVVGLEPGNPLEEPTDTTEDTATRLAAAQANIAMTEGDK